MCGDFHGFSVVHRVFLGGLLGLCVALFSVPSLAADWVPIQREFDILKKDVAKGFLEVAEGVTITQDGKLVRGAVSGGSVSVGNQVALRSRLPAASASTGLSKTFPTSVVKNAAGACLKAPVRCNLVGLGLTAGFSALLDGVDWVMDNSGVIRKVGGDYSQSDLPIFLRDVGGDFDGLSPTRTVNYVRSGYDEFGSALSDVLGQLQGIQGYFIGVYVYKISTVDPSTLRVAGSYCLYYPDKEFLGADGYVIGSNCYYRNAASVPVPPPFSLPPLVESPVSEAEIDSVVESDYMPVEDDLAPLLDGFDLVSDDGSVYNLEQPPTVDLGVESVVNRDENGQIVGSTDTHTSLDFSVSGNDSPNLSVSVDVTRDTDVYDAESNLVSSSSSSSSSPAASSDLSGCSLFDPFCEWADWTREDFVEDDVDLEAVLAVQDFEPDVDDVSISLGSAVCPQPIVLNLPVLNREVELSWQPICDYLLIIKPLILAAAYLLSALIFLRSFRG